MKLNEETGEEEVDSTRTDDEIQEPCDMNNTLK